MNKNNGEELVQGGLQRRVDARGVVPDVLLTKTIVSGWCKEGGRGVKNHPSIRDFVEFSSNLQFFLDFLQPPHDFLQPP